MASGTIFGALLGWRLAGPAGGLLGSLLGTWFASSMPGTTDVLQEMLGGMAAESTEQLFKRISEKTQHTLPTSFENKIQEALQQAFQQAVFDISGNDCRDSLFQRNKRQTAADIGYLVSPLRQKNADLANQVCNLFRILHDSAAVWFPNSTAIEPISFQLSFSTSQDINSKWVETQLQKFLEPFALLLSQIKELGEVYDFEAHLKRHLYPRIIEQVGYQLQRDPELWRVYILYFQQNLLAQTGVQTEQITAQIQTLAPNVFQAAHLCKEFAGQLSEHIKATDQQWANLIEQYRIILRTIEQTQKETAQHLDKLLEDLWEEDLVIEWIGSEEMQPLTPQDKRLVLGQTIEIRHIREDRFMHRPDVLQDVWEALHKVVEKAKSARLQGDPQLFTLWINGRSGSGKSVLLLQLLQRLVLEEQASVLWLQDNSLALPELIKRWPRLSLPTDDPVFIFLDDFYDLQAREELDLQPIARAMRLTKAPQIKWPILVTCSPPENMHQLMAESPEKMNFEPWPLPKLEPDDMDQIKQWYTQKTGEIAKTGSAFEQDEGLFVSTMVEIEHGELKAFAQRFKKRLEAANLVEELTPMLALNRLYLWPPVAWFNDGLLPEQKDAFDLLNKDEDFSLNKLSGIRNSIRLTHPHISNAIYNALRPPTTSRQSRKQDLINIYQRAINDQSPLASMLLHKINDDFAQTKFPSKVENSTISFLEPRLTDLCEEEPLFQPFWQVWQTTDSTKMPPGQQIWMWVNWAESYALLGKEYLDLFSICIDSACSLLGQHTRIRHWGMNWSKLWKLMPNYYLLAKTALNWLKYDFTQDIPEWSLVWQKLMDKPDSLSDIEQNNMITQGFHWLFRREDLPEWAYIWNGLIDFPRLPKNIKRDTIYKRGFDWLTNREDRNEWSHVWRTLIEAKHLPPNINHNDLLTLGFVWLHAREDRKEWAYVWRALLDAKRLPADIDRDNLLTRGFIWLGGRQERPEWAHIWRRLLKTKSLPKEVSRDFLISNGYEWLNGREDRPEWNYVWQKLVALDPLPKTVSKESLLLIGYNWLNNREDRKEWNYVWQTLANEKSLPEMISYNELLSTGYNWLYGREDIDGWSYVWRILTVAKLIPLTINREILLSNGYEWLDGREECHDWSHIWRGLVTAKSLPKTINRNILFSKGYNWLNGRENCPEWSYVWRTLTVAKTLPETIHRDTLLSIGNKWLSNRENRPEWSYVWRTLMAAKSLPEAIDRDVLLSTGYEWLNGRENRPEWSHMWQKLVSEKSLQGSLTHENLLLIGYEWLNGREDRPEWNYVWSDLLKAKTMPETVNRDLILYIGYEWLNGREDRPEWSHMWQKLTATKSLPETVARERLLSIGYDWLQNRNDHPRWAPIWRTLTTTETLPKTISRDVLISNGNDWLNGRENHQEWSLIWRTLMATETLPKTISRDVLITSGFNWLNNRGNHQEWANVWKALINIKAMPETLNNDLLLTMGYDWLNSQKDRQEWVNVWKILIKIQSFPEGIGLSGLLSIGFNWLDGHEVHPEWGNVWEVLINANTLPETVNRDLLYSSGFDWLQGHNDRPQWIFIWQTLATAETLPKTISRDSLLSNGYDWLNSYKGHLEWVKVWEKYWQGTESSHTLNILFDWFNTDYPQPKSVFWLSRNTLAKIENDAILGQLQTWLQSNQSHWLYSTIYDGLKDGDSKLINIEK